jgi:hypothetical protein
MVTRDISRHAVDMSPPRTELTVDARVDESDSPARRAMDLARQPRAPEIIGWRNNDITDLDVVRPVPFEVTFTDRCGDELFR